MPAIASVLIIDDEESVRQVLVEIFKEEGVAHICDVPSAEKGLEMLEKEPFTLIVCDYHLQGMNGIAFMGKLRVKGDRTPILLITGIPDKTPVMQAATQLNADFLAKPFSIPQLLGAVEKLLNVP